MTSVPMAIMDVLADHFGTPLPGGVLEPLLRIVIAREDEVRAEARAAVLAEEDRRVWCEDYARSLLLFQSPETADASANGKLAAYREARAAWDARGEG